MLRGFLENVVQIIYPKKCLVCKTKLEVSAAEGLVCLHCWAKAKNNLPPFCFRCGRHLKEKSLHKNVCPECTKGPWHFDRAFSPYQYEGVIKELIHEFKYKGKDYLGKPLSELMINFIREFDLPMDYMDCIIPIPLHRARLRER